MVSDNVQSSRVFEEELAGHGIPAQGAALVRRPDAGDRGTCATTSGSPPTSGPSAARSGGASAIPCGPCGSGSRRWNGSGCRELGRTLTHAVEATCRNFDRGEREADVAGHLAHRLLREGVVPVDLRVASDDRLARFRQPTFKAAPIMKRATIAVTGRRLGLCASVTRTVSFGPVEPEFRQPYSCRDG